MSNYKMRLSTRQILLRSLFLFLIWRFSLFLFSFFGLHLTEEFDLYNAGKGIINSGKHWFPFPNNLYFDSFFRFDSTWYDGIIQNGYTLKKGASNVAFFPLYPYLSRWLGTIVGNYFVAGWLISNLSLIGSIFFIYRIGLLNFRPKITERALVLLLLFPSSFFLSTFYTEGLFLFTTSASFYYFLTKKYGWAGIWGLLANLTRFSGILLFIAFTTEILCELWQKKIKFDYKMINLILIPLGIGIFMLILYVQVGDPLSFLQAQNDWGREKTFPLVTLAKGFNSIDFSFPRKPFDIIRFFNWLSAVSFLILSLFMALRKYSVSLWTYTMISVLLPLSTGSLMSMMRFCAVTFPAFFFLADISKKLIVYSYLLFMFAYLLSIFQLRFMNWHFIG